MALLPYWGLNEIRPRRLHDQVFGLPISTDDILTDLIEPVIGRHYIRPWRKLATTAKDAGSKITVDKDKFQVELDVQQFKPDEVTVKTVDGCVVIEGEHEERKDEHGYVRRAFKRRYVLPEGFKEDSVEARLSSDGVLNVEARRPMQRERTITVTRSNDSPAKVPPAKKTRR